MGNVYVNYRKGLCNDESLHPDSFYRRFVDSVLQFRIPSMLQLAGMLQCCTNPFCRHLGAFPLAGYFHTICWKWCFPFLLKRNPVEHSCIDAGAMGWCSARRYKYAARRGSTTLERNETSAFLLCTASKSELR
jgi:hypothetical protein